MSPAARLSSNELLLGPVQQENRANSAPSLYTVPRPPVAPRPTGGAGERNRLNQQPRTWLEPITAQRVVRTTRSALQDHLTDHLSALAELETMVGAAFPGPDTSESKPQ